MDAIYAIFSRRSIRRYKKEAVPDSLMRELLEAAMSAPSAGNQQPWHFVIIHERSLLDRIPEFHPYSQMLREAPAAILVCADLTLEKFDGYWVQDCSAATQNILLAAHARGLGAVWTGVYPYEERIAGMRRLLDLPDNVMPLSLIPVGYRAEENPRVNRYESSRLHYNRW